MLPERIETINIDSEFEKFYNHVSVENNNRIIFSAPFGSGKTYFLKDFFEKYNEQFNGIFINPVKYSVASNADIFELIKFDIILHLFESGLIESIKSESDFESVTPEWFIYEEILKKKPRLLEYFGTILPLLNPEAKTTTIATLTKIVPTILTVLKKVHPEYQKYGTEKKEELKTYEEKLSDYIEKAISKSYIHEQDEITLILKEILSRIKEKDSSPKQNILVIDDFDRLDPEHVFRILNVLSVHNDRWDSNNKFGFDKIIIVCDIDNIHKLFKHRYGVDADFSGYIDKFCSTHYYRYSIEQQILLFLQSKILPNVKEGESDEIIAQLYLLTGMITYFVKNKRLSLRNILKANFNFEIPNKQIIHAKLNYDIPEIRNSHIQVFTSEVPFLKTLKILISIWGDINSLMSDLETGNSTNLSYYINEEYINKMIESLVLALHLSYKESDELVRHHSKYNDHINRSELPEAQLGNLKYRIKLQYTKENPYNTDKKLFKNVRFLLLSNSTIPIATNTFFEAILNIIRQFKSKQYLKDFDF